MTSALGEPVVNTAVILEQTRDALYESLAAVEAERKKSAGDPVRFNELTNAWNEINDKIIDLIAGGLKQRTSEYVAIGKNIAQVNEELEARKKELEQMAANLQLAASCLKVVTDVLAIVAKFVV